MNIFTPLVILVFGGPPLVVMWAVKKLTGRETSEGAAIGLIFLAIFVVVNVALELEQ